MSAITIHAAGVDFHTQVRGSHPGAVFLHGLGGDLHTWDGVWNALGERLPAMRYDLRGFGRSVCRQQVLFKHADDLLSLLDASAIERCDLIGVSMGASIALNFTLDHPGRVRSLVLISPGLVGWEWSQMWRQLWDPILDHVRRGALDEARCLWWQHPLLSTTRNSDAGPALFESIMRSSPAEWLDDHHELMFPDVERLHLLQTRTLLLTGDRDLDDFRLIADLIEGCAGNLQRVDQPGLGHLLHLEDPEGCARRISSFLQAPPK